MKKILPSLVSNEVDNNIVNLINKQTGGNQLFIREIIYQLYDTKKLILEKDKIYFDKKAITEFKIDLVKKIIVNRLNSLNPKINCLLQAAAVVGQSFNTVVLKHILNYEETVIMNYLEISRKLNLVKYEEKSDKYKFSYNKIRETLLTEVKDTNKKKEIIYKLNKILQKERKIKNKAEILFEIWGLLQKGAD